MKSKIISFLLCVVLVCLTAFISPTVAIRANAATMGYVDATNVNIRVQPVNGASLGKISNEMVVINGSVAASDGYTWYNITTNSGITGYMRGDFIKILPSTDGGTDKNFEEQLADFPESYKSYLRALHAIYPNWVFVADKVDTSFADALAEEYIYPRKLVSMTSDGISWRSMGDGSYDWSNKGWNTTAGNWTGASREVIAYYMDPRNFINANDIYMFLQQSYDQSTQSESGVSQMVAGTYLAKGYNDPKDTAYGGSYVKVIMAAAKESGVNPYILAATLIIEQGVNGSSDLISGTNATYPEYYNFFNYKASGDNVILNGLSYAQSMGWNTRSKAIIGGAKKYAEEYINKGQDTYYYKDFNVITLNYSHQYAQSVYDARVSSARVRSMFINDKNGKLVFRIPVFTSIPDTVYSMPVENDKRNNYFLSEMSVSGLSPSFSMYTQSYSLSVSGDTSVYVNALSGATIVSPMSVALKAGNNSVNVTVRAETGYTNTYTLKVNATKASKLTFTTDSQVDTETEEPVNGDINGDKTINVIDLAQIQLYLVGRITLGESSAKSADTNGDGAVNVIDLARLQLHLVGRINLLE